MSVINVTNVEVRNNPAKYGDPFEFEIVFECPHGLNGELEWKCIYVGSAESEKYDQVLESVVVGPIPSGVNKFVFEADAPDVEYIPKNEILGITVVLITCSFQEKEFLRVGYYVTNEYDDPKLNEEPPSTPLFGRMVRSVLHTQPRVTWFQINWEELLADGDPNRANLPELPGEDAPQRTFAGEEGAEVGGGSGEDIAFDDDEGYDDDDGYDDEEMVGDDILIDDLEEEGDFSLEDEDEGSSDDLIAKKQANDDAVAARGGIQAFK